MTSNPFNKAKIITRAFYILALVIIQKSELAIAGPYDGIEGTEQLFAMWGNVTVNGRFSKDSPWVYWGDISLRSAQQYSTPTDSERNMVLGAVVTHDAIGYKFNDNHVVHVGYAFQHSNNPYASQAVNENRAWEQYTYSRPTSMGGFSSRSRLEQRTVNIEHGGNVGVRFRQQLKLSYPLTDKWSLVGSDEIFVNANTPGWGPVAGLDQNRVFVGVGYKFDKVWRTEIGYMNQYINRDLVYDRDFDTVSLNLFVDVPDE